MQQSGSNNNHGSQASNSIPQSNIPVPIPRTNFRKVDLLTSDPDSDTNTKVLNCFDDEFVTHGYISNIYTSIIVDSDAKRSIVSSNFTTLNMSPVKQELLFGISQVIFQFSVYELPIDIPTLKGVARFADCPITLYC